MKQGQKIAAIVLSIILVFMIGVFSGARKGITISVSIKNASPSAGVAANNTVPTVITPQPTAAAPQTATPHTTAPQASTNDNSQTADTIQPQQTTQAQNQGGMSVNEIVELYNSSANRVKSEASSITRNYKNLSSVDEYLQLPSAIQGLGKTAMNQFVKGSETPESWSTKEDIQLVFPVGGTDYTSHLTADMVENATCTDNGNTYQIEIKLYNDKITSPAKGEGYAGVFNTVTASTFEDINIPTVTFNQVNVNGINGSISCTIDKASKRVTEITFRNTDILALNVKVVISTIDAQIALAVEENYTVAY